ncbi:bacillithiol system redox-active protein YtxJ [soil metagenome]
MSATFNRIDTFDRLDEVFAASHERPVIIFKHSNSCGISADLQYQLGSVNGEINIVVVQESRALSDAVAERTGFRHQSPQVFVIENGKPVYQASHYAIDPRAIEKHISK